ncbi:DUF1853 family protein [Seongchinamella sediminis]|uniref:DUF1853 family protein n=1 Tax=Seongchinamella sediminis TaxID=2283635 RepID=A0A3L7DYW6_9GAMM|nr:DUF1853 family protein [Seongchinamella sediminis]RLQ22406.1 DUF1853 family protein [Seongchinamella sediminis]
MRAPIVAKDWYYNHVNAFPENTLRELRTAEVRDLAWSCFSPPLFDADLLPAGESPGNCHFALTAARRRWLRQLDAQPAELLQFIASANSRRLGLYFESLWQFFLRSDPQVELLASNLPVRAEGRTLGEFDLIYFCHQRQRAIHLELALKFYLCAPGRDGSEWRHWLGPNSHDRLDLKLGRMLQHQVRLSEQAPAREVLARLGAESPLRELAVRGRLYRQYGARGGTPPGCNNSQPMHLWTHAGNARAILANSTAVRLARRQWLAPLHPVSGTGEPAWPAEQSGRARQFALLDASGCEQQRLFVVADDWPQEHG